MTEHSAELTDKIRNSPDYDLRLAAARRRAEWELGDASWAGIIISAFLFPAEDAEALSAEQGDGA